VLVQFYAVETYLLVRIRTVTSIYANETRLESRHLHRSGHSFYRRSLHIGILKICISSIVLSTTISKILKIHYANVLAFINNLLGYYRFQNSTLPKP
jgi:hypothetical protein